MWELFQFVGIFLKKNVLLQQRTIIMRIVCQRIIILIASVIRKKRLLRMINCVGNGFTDTAIIRKNPIIQTPHQGTNQLYYELRRGGHI